MAKKKYKNMKPDEKRAYLRALDRHMTFITHLDHFMVESTKRTQLIEGLSPGGDVSHPWRMIETDPIGTVIFLRFAMIFVLLESIIEERKIDIDRLEKTIISDDFVTLRQYRNAIFHIPDSKEDDRIQKFFNEPDSFQKVDFAKRLIDGWILFERGEKGIPRGT